MRRWVSICLCLVLLLGLSVANAQAEEQSFADLRYTLPEGWTQNVTASEVTLSYPGNGNESGMVFILSQDMSVFANAGLNDPALAQMYLELLLENIFKEMGATLPDISTPLLVDNQTAVRYPLQNNGVFVDAVGILYDQTAYLLIAMGAGETPYAEYETLLASLNFGNVAGDSPAQDDPLAALSDADVTTLRDRAIEALDAGEIIFEDEELTVGEDIAAGRYELSVAEVDGVAVVSVADSEERFGVTGNERMMCEFAAGDVVKVVGSARLVPYLKLPAATDIQDVKDAEFLLLPGLVDFVSGPEFIQYTHARSGGEFYAAACPLEDGMEGTPEEIFLEILSDAEGLTLAAADPMEIEGRPAIRFSMVSDQDLSDNLCMEGLMVLDGREAYVFRLYGQDLYQDDFACGLDVLAGSITFDGIEPLPELSAQTDLEGLSEITLRRIYTLCEFSLIRRGATPVSLPKGLSMVGVDVPAGTYAAETTSLFRYTLTGILTAGTEPMMLVLEDGQTMQSLGETTLTPQ